MFQFAAKVSSNGTADSALALLSCVGDSKPALTFSKWPGQVSEFQIGAPPGARLKVYVYDISIVINSKFFVWLHFWVALAVPG